MTDKPNDGGSAFPNEGGDFSGLHADPGMTLRDYFAAQALTGMMANPDTFKNEKAGGAELRARLTGSCYAIADAMLAERSK